MPAAESEKLEFSVTCEKVAVAGDVESKEVVGQCQ